MENAQQTAMTTIPLDAPDGWSRNFWTIKAGNADGINEGDLCIKGMSDFTTANGGTDRASESFVNNRMVAIFLDELVVSDAIMTGTVEERTFQARSKSKAEDGAYNVKIESIRQLAVPEDLRPQMWMSTADKVSDGKTLGKVSFIEERNDWDHNNDVKAQPKWEDRNQPQQDASFAFCRRRRLAGQG